MCELLWGTYLEVAPAAVVAGEVVQSGSEDGALGLRTHLGALEERVAAYEVIRLQPLHRERVANLRRLRSARSILLRALTRGA